MPTLRSAAGGEPAHARADDRNRKRPCHRVPRPRLFSLTAIVAYAGRNPACASACRARIRRQRLQKRLHRRPLLALPSPARSHNALRRMNETQTGRMRDRRNRHAPVGAMLCHRRGDRVVRARLIPVAVGPGLAEQPVDQDRGCPHPWLWLTMMQAGSARAARTAASRSAPSKRVSPLRNTMFCIRRASPVPVRARACETARCSSRFFRRTDGSARNRIAAALGCREPAEAADRD